MSVINKAEEVGNREAARIYSINESTVRGWRKSKETLEKSKRSSKALGRGRKAHYPLMEEELVKLVSERRKEGCAISTVEIRVEAQKMVKRYYPEASFKASSQWCYLFMKRHDISVRRRTSIAQSMPEDAEDKLLKFQQFVINLLKKHNYRLSAMATADQTALTFDLPYNQDIRL